MIPKLLKTYVVNICFSSAFTEKYKGLRIAVTNSAMIELINEGKTLFDVVRILEEGYDAPRQRKAGIIEK
ncbi:hypothetical protein KY329_03150, partial [Candidatus Woesearchaeota archaeon]|nr:hypothetical protein [Candidatus Woesearchaeota archaeon]